MKSLFGVILLFLYIAGNVEVDSFHQLFHAYEKELHSSEQEKDPCHRAIYHDSKKDGCDHKTHLTEIKKCPLCHVVPHNEQNIAAGHSHEGHFLQDAFNNAFYLSQSGEIFSDLSVRGPPIV